MDGAKSYLLLVAEEGDLDNAWKFPTTSTSYDLYNCKIGTTYCWAVQAVDANGKVGTQLPWTKFTTADQTPRNLYCGEITNMRDIGGWQTVDGNRVKQGLLYRSGQLDKNGDPVITPEGVTTMVEQLHIRTEIDIREEKYALSASVVKGVNYISLPMGYDSMVTQRNNLQVCKIFELLADENNYPILIHCSIGTDRTGYLSFLINGVLGVDENDLYRDYLFSNFGTIESSRALKDITGQYVKRIRMKEGETWQQKTEAFLLTIGVNKEQLDGVRRILLEKAR